MKRPILAILTVLIIIVFGWILFFSEKPFNGVDDSLLAQANVSNGEQLYNQMNSTGFACVSCHFIATDERAVGPSLRQIATIAETRVNGQSAADYLYLSIARPSKHLTPDFGDQIMPMTYETIYTEAEILDLVAYLLTLDGSQIIVAEQTEQPTSNPTSVGTPDIVATLASFGRPVAGRELYIATLSDGSRCIDCHADASAFSNITRNISLEQSLYDGIVTSHENDYESILSTSQKYDLVAYLRDPQAAIPTAVPTQSPITQGEILFNSINVTGFSCASCHYANSSDMLVGPGLAQISTIASTRVEGQSAEQYLLNAIITPNEHLVNGFVAMVMPQTYATIYTEQELNYLVAYLMTLGD